MSKIWEQLKTEPAAIFGTLTAIAAAAAGVWNEPWLAFAAAATAAVGAVFTRQNVTPLVKK